jgi:ornithine cyclodeaminase/alanine dehydrogenase-like protein (mu-crystallin family)
MKLCTTSESLSRASAPGVGDVILSKAPIFAEAGEVFAGTKQPARSVTTIFKSVGIAVEDIAAARIIYNAVASAH